MLFFSRVEKPLCKYIFYVSYVMYHVMIGSNVLVRLVVDVFILDILHEGTDCICCERFRQLNCDLHIPLYNDLSTAWLKLDIGVN